ncbi:ribosomal protection-like ABC-F family protein [Bacillus horti]|uniref:Macrolide transport system ATP-binding/permease protein n=1 Tax=Caldalkalibacillus horti TaxID=77523 RepID=A0ABT9W1D7_9BACI|nr:ABC-F type ribosomal protection protein [Bacillus horti]MDQ0166665.1 macrolide transport system ATP-binding/permease protein [Bacillus horti]
MLLLHAKQIEKSYKDRLLFRLDELSIHKGERIGIVGSNGAGKTTLLHILSGKIHADQGEVQRYGRQAFIAQEGGPDSFHVQNDKSDLTSEEIYRDSNRFFKELGLEQQQTFNVEHLSGGEETKLKLATAFGVKGDLLFADEPTSHLDIEGIQYLEKYCQSHSGALVIISHDRRFLDQVCTKIIELEAGKVTEYHGNYSEYKKQKELQLLTQQQEYDSFVREKKRLTEAIIGRKERAKSVKKAPKRMGNSEARLHKRKAMEKREKLEGAQKALETRLEKLERKEKPKEQEKIHMPLPSSLQLHAKFAIQVPKINVYAGEKSLVKNLSFQLKTGSRLALVGPNGCGKSTFIKMILDRAEGLMVAQGVKFGYFSQRLESLNGSSTILEEVLEDTIQEEDTVRSLLSRIGFERESVNKRISYLSGGEKVKVAIAKLLVGKHNVLLLDEPTNFLDVLALEALEELISSYEGTIIFVTHDRQFVDRIATHVAVFNEQKIHYFQGNYAQYVEAEKQRAEAPEQITREQLLVLENKLQEVIGRLSLPAPSDNLEALEEEYQLILKQIKEVKQ